MEPKRLFLTKDRKLPDVVVIPITYEKPRKEANYIEKILFFIEATSGRSKLTVLSKRIIEKIGGLDSSLGFGEDKTLYRKALKLVSKN